MSCNLFINCHPASMNFRDRLTLPVRYSFLPKIKFFLLKIISKDAPYAPPPNPSVYLFLGLFACTVFFRWGRVGGWGWVKIKRPASLQPSLSSSVIARRVFSSTKQSRPFARHHSLSEVEDAECFSRRCSVFSKYLCSSGTEICSARRSLRFSRAIPTYR